MHVKAIPPLYYLIFSIVNNIYCCFQCKKIADDTKLYFEVTSVDDARIVQNDLD